MSELSPKYEIQVWLDGDDDPETQTLEFEQLLKDFLSDTRQNRRIISWDYKRV